MDQMLIPLGTDRPLKRPTLVTYVLIGLNVAVYVVMIVLKQAAPGAYNRVFDLFMLRPGHATYELVGYAFLHDTTGVISLHLLFNMLFLYVFGPNIEDRFGRIGFAAFYLVAAGFSGGAHLLLDGAPVIGASGAVSGLTGAYLVLFPRARVRIFYFLFLIGVGSLPAWVFIAFSIGWDLVSQALGFATGVAYLAHLGGYVLGASVSVVLLGFKVLPREPYDLFTIGRQAYRRRQFKEAGLAHDKRVAKHWQRAKTASASQRSDHAAAARAEITRLLGDNETDQAATRYKHLLDQHAADPRAVTMSRRNQYDLANHFLAVSDHQTAATAYQLFLDAYPNDAEAPRIRLLLGRVLARYLNDPLTAKQLLSEAIEGLHDEEELAIARQELDALG